MLQFHLAFVGPAQLLDDLAVVFCHSLNAFISRQTIDPRGTVVVLEEYAGFLPVHATERVAAPSASFATVNGAATHMAVLH